MPSTVEWRVNLLWEKNLPVSGLVGKKTNIPFEDVYPDTCHNFQPLQSPIRQLICAPVMWPITVHWSPGMLLGPLSLATVSFWAWRAPAPLKKGSRAGWPSTHWRTYARTPSTPSLFTLNWTMSSARVSLLIWGPVSIQTTKLKWRGNCSI